MSYLNYSEREPPECGPWQSVWWAQAGSWHLLHPHWGEVELRPQGRAVGQAVRRAHPGSWGSLALEAVGGSLSRFPFLCHFLFDCYFIILF